MYSNMSQERHTDFLLEATEQKSAQQPSDKSTEKPKKSRKKKNKEKMMDADSDMATIRERSGVDSIRVKNKSNRKWKKKS